MSSKTTFKCNFCGQEIVETVSPDGLQGWGMSHTAGTGAMTWELKTVIDSCHICGDCVDLIVTHANSAYNKKE